MSFIPHQPIGVLFPRPLPASRMTPYLVLPSKSPRADLPSPTSPTSRAT
jgi:hypothetical protein